MFVVRDATVADYMLARLNREKADDLASWM